jgi:hypothetical protein
MIRSMETSCSPILVENPRMVINHELESFSRLNIYWGSGFCEIDEIVE